MKKIYTGFFLDVESMEKLFGAFQGHLNRMIPDMHITTAFRPQTIDESLFGEEIGLTVTGYGNDGSNEGVSVRLTRGSEKARAEFAKVQVPHVTISVSENGKPVDTAKLRFRSGCPAVELTARFGAFCADKVVRYSA